MKRKGMLTAVVLAAVMLLLQITGSAADIDYSGPIDSFTGEPISISGFNQNGERIPMTSGVYYDRMTRTYVYDLGGSSRSTISASVMDGMIVNGVVEIEPSQDVEIRLYRNGDPVENTELPMLETPGRYVLEARILGDQYVRVMSFTIVGGVTNLINSYPMPSGFVIKNVELSVKDENGDWVDAKPQWDRSKVSMSQDGSYRVEYECARTGLSYTLQTEIDHTPPALALENVVNGLAKGPVDISDLEEGCKIGIALNGGRMNYREELTLSGDYEILLQDEAGNLTSYEFTILVYLDMNSWIFFGMVLLALAGVGVYLYLERKRVRIR